MRTLDAVAARSLRDALTPLRTLDPTDADRDDLAAPSDVVGDARVVGLGETAHFTAELARLRDRVLRYLVEHVRHLSAARGVADEAPR